MTSEIGKDAPSNVIYRRDLKPGPQYPDPTEVDNIALRREISRLRQELKQQLSAQELCAHTADRLGVEISELRAEREGLEAAVQGLRHKLERKSIKNKMRRVLGIFNGERAVGA